MRATNFTARVMAAGAWTLAGQATTTIVTLLCTPFGIRALGVEFYGLLALINLILNYTGFADLGLGQASTRFGAGEYARGSRPGEASVVWTSLALTACASTGMALLLGAGAPFLFRNVFSLPEHHVPVATLALRITLVGFVARHLAGVLNTVVLVRLLCRADTMITTVPLALQIVLVPVVVWLGGGLAGAAVVIASASIATALAQALVAQRLLPELRRPCFRRSLVSPLLRYSVHLVAGSMVGLLIFGLEKAMVVRFASVRTFAHYTIAAMLANVVAIGPTGAMNSLLSAFSQLHESGQRERLEALYRRAHRMVLLGLPPIAILIFAFVKPFLTLWAGPEFGRESTGPACILVLAAFVQMINRVSKELLKAHGRTDVFLRFYLYELVPYVLVVAACVYLYSATGAAIAFLLRACVDAFLVTRAATITSRFPFAPLRGQAGTYGLALLALASPLVFLPFAGGPLSYLLLAFGVLGSGCIYGILVWRRVVSDDERTWIRGVAERLLGRFRGR